MNLRGMDLTVSDIRLINNRAYDLGGAGYIENTGCAFVNCEFIRNSTDTSRAGAVYLDSSSNSFRNCMFDHNNGAKTPREVYNCDKNNFSNCHFYSNYSSGDLCSSSPFGINGNEYHGDVQPENLWKGSGTAEDPYLIEVESDLAALAAGLDSGKDYEGVYFHQNRDVEGITFDIGYNNAFCGNYDGGGHSITVDLKGNEAVGLFAKTNQGAVIENLTVAGTVSGTNFVGGLIGMAQQTIVRNCMNQAEVTATGYDVGGIAGSAGDTVMEACRNVGDISGDQNVGGIVGYTISAGSPASDTVPQMENCSNRGTVTARSCAGGMAGRSQTAVQITMCNNDGDISSENYAGGMVGMIVKGGFVDGPVLLTDCRNSGTVCGSSAAGGIVGYLSAFKAQAEEPMPQEIRNCVNNGRVQGPNAGGIVGNATTDNKDYSLVVDGCQNQGAVCAHSTNASSLGGIVGTGIGTIRNCINSSGARFEPGSNAQTKVGGIIGKAGVNSGTDATCWLYNNLNMGAVTASGNAGLLAGQINNAEVMNFASHNGNPSTIGQFAGGVALGEAENCFVAPVSGDSAAISTEINRIVAALNQACAEHPEWLKWSYSGAALRLAEGENVFVTFHYEQNGVLSDYVVSCVKGSTVTVPAVISQEGHKIQWYVDSKMTQPYSLLTVVNNDLELYGQWECNHNTLELVKGYEPTRNDYGLRDAWMCPVCGGYFADEAGEEYLGGALGYDLWTRFSQGKLGKLSNGFLNYYGSSMREQPYPNAMMTLSGYTTAWGDGGGATSYYLVDTDTVINSLVTVQGNVAVIVKDGCTLELMDGVKLLGSGKLTLFGQSTEPTTGRIIIHPNSGKKAAVFTDISLKNTPTFEVVSANVVAKSAGLPAISLNVDVSFDATKTLLIAQGKDGANQIILSLLVNAIQGIKNQTIHDFIFGDVEFLPVLTGDMSGFQQAMESVLDKVKELKTLLTQAGQEAKYILPWAEQLPFAIEKLNDMMGMLDNIPTNTLSFLMDLVPSFLNDMYGMSLEDLQKAGWNVDAFPYIQVNNGNLKNIQLVGQGDAAAAVDPRLMLFGMSLETEELFVDTENLTVLGAEYLQARWPNARVYSGEPRLALHMNNLSDLMALGKLQVWMLGKDGSVKELEPVFDKENSTIFVTTEARCSIMITRDGSSVDPENCRHEELTFLPELPSTCLVEGTAEHYICITCGSVFADQAAEVQLEEPEKLPLAEHQKLELVPGIPAECDVDGIADYYRCDVCQAIFADAAGKQPLEEPQIKPAPGHKLKSVIVKAQPGKDGKITESCTVCGSVVAEKVISAPANVTATATGIGLLGRLLNALRPKVVVTDADGEVISGSSYSVFVLGRNAIVTFRGAYYKGTMTARIR